ncbi:MAG TPA: ABC transporter permease [Anaerolineales bacterium]|nr:ABC transporter permease [Anaerolineales bacterium]
MTQYIIRRLAIIPPILLLANFLGFSYAHYFRPLRDIYNPYASAVITTPPLFSEYLSYLEDLTRLELGVMPTGEPILDLLIRTSIASAGLLVISLVLSAVAGLLLGLSAVKLSPPRVASWLTFMGTVGLASPSFYIGILFISFSILYLISGLGRQPLLPFQGYGWDAHLVLPVLALMAQPTVKVAQVTAGLLVGELGKQYVIAARSFGLSLPTIKRRHAFRNIIVPVVLTVAGSLRLLIAELIIIERLFSWPGLGRVISTTLVVTSHSENYLLPSLFSALVTIVVALILATDFLAAIAIRAYDPRLGTS